MSITQDILEKLRKEKTTFSLLDPEDQTPEDAGKLAKLAEEAGSSAMMVGGSTLVSAEQVDGNNKSNKSKFKATCDTLSIRCKISQ